MNRTVSHVLLSLACFAAVFGAIAVAVDEAMPDESNPDGVYDIDYILNGGVQNPMNPSKYEKGDAVEFQFPFSTEGLYFGGWYSDSELNHLCMSIDAGSEGDISLYAKWQSEPTGITCVFDSSILTVCDFDMTIEETLVFTAQGFDDGNIYVICSSGPEESDTWAEWYEWSGGSEVVGTETLDTLFGERPCNIMRELSTGDMYWTDAEYGWTYKIVIEADSPTIVATYILKSVGIAEAPEKMTLTVEAESGIVSESGGEYSTTGEVELSAEVPEGKVFGGWYGSDGILISEEPVCKYNVYWTDETVCAKYDHEYAYVLTKPTSSIVLECEGPEISWELFKNGGESVKTGTGNSIEYDFDSTGYYRVNIDDPGSECQEFVLIKVDIVPEVLTFEWTYEGIGYSYAMKADHEHFLDCEEYLEDRRSIAYTPELDREIILFEDPYVKEIAEMLSSRTVGFSDADRVNMAMCFVQSPCTPYEQDSYLSDIFVYNKTAYETMYLNGGECYDTSVLLASILHEMGYDCALFTFMGHAAVGVVLEDFEGDGLTKDGVKYFYCETTSEGWTVGENIPDSLMPVFVTVV